MLKYVKNIIFLNIVVVYINSRVRCLRIWNLELDCLGSIPALLASSVTLGKLAVLNLNFLNSKLGCSKD